MNIKQVKLKNFRGYKDELIIDIAALTVFVGRNDIGKSTILEALDIFFNEGKGAIKIDASDVNKQALKEDDSDIVITVIFDKIVSDIVIDDNNKTTLKNEYLLNKEGDLEVVKTFSNGGKAKVYIKAKHPTNEKCKDLLLKKNKELKEILDHNNINCNNKSINSELRKAIWNHYSTSLDLKEIEIDASKEDAKDIWGKLSNHMPLYTLFQSDRSNSDGDGEIQNPMKLAVKEIFSAAELSTELNKIADTVKNKLEEIADQTLEKIKEMNPEIAKELKPTIPETENLKWADVFKAVNINSDEGIPINKRGSGVKRLVLLNFFRAEAERRQKEQDVPSIIYAIEEPETSQHYHHQEVLINALKKLSEVKSTQILLTTHSGYIVKGLDFKNLRLISNTNNKKTAQLVEEQDLPYPSLNEINFVAFGEVNEEYHNELYGYIEGEKKLPEFEKDYDTRKYIRIKYIHINKNGGKNKEYSLVLTKYIRHQIHHPENQENKRFTPKELKESINLMRDFIKKLKDN